MPREVELIIETGVGVEDANSFVTEQQIVTYARARGVVIPNDTDEANDAIAIMAISAMDYLNSLPWRGQPTYPLNGVCWPRTGVYGYEANQIPAAIKQAQMQLAMAVQAGVSLLPVTTSGGVITKEQIGPIVTEYSEKFGMREDGRPIIPAVDGLLLPFLLADEPICVGLWAIGS